MFVYISYITKYIIYIVNCVYVIYSNYGIKRNTACLFKYF